MSWTEPFFRSLAWLILISGTYFLRDGWVCHSWLDKGNAYQAKRLLRRSILAGTVLLLSTVATCSFLLEGLASPRLSAAAIITIMLGSLMNLNAGHRLVRQLY